MAIRVPENGVPGKLTPDQQKYLKQFWAEFFKLVSSAASEDSSRTSRDQKTNGSSTSSTAPTTPTSSSSSSDDAAKERRRLEENYRDAQLALQKHGPEKFMSAFWRMVAMDDPDGVMLRFLRARKWNVQAGVTMLAACLKWRMESNIVDIMHKGEEGMLDKPNFIRQLERGKAYVQGVDRRGRPILYIHVAKHKASDQTLQELKDLCLFQIESARLLLYPPLDKVTLFFDMTGFSMSNMDWNVLKFIITCLEAYYPESLNVIIIHSAPWIFQGLWKMISPLLDPVVRAKVQFTQKADELLVHIDKQHLIQALGGSSDWTWRYTPVQKNENEIMSDATAKQEKEAHRQQLIQFYELITKDWMATSDAGETTTAATIQNVRDLARNALRVQYWELDPYVRAKSVYHRHGNAVGNGLVRFNYTSSPPYPPPPPPTSSSITSFHSSSLSSSSSSTAAAKTTNSSTTTNNSQSPPPRQQVDGWQVMGHEGAKEVMELECARLFDLISKTDESKKYTFPPVIERIVNAGKTTPDVNSKLN